MSRKIIKIVIFPSNSANMDVSSLTIHAADGKLMCLNNSQFKIQDPTNQQSMKFTLDLDTCGQVLSPGTD